MAMPAPPIDISSASINVLKHKNFYIVSGNGVSFGAGQPDPTVFGIKCDTFDSGPLSSGLARERIQNYKFAGTLKLLDGGWIPPQSIDAFHLMRGGNKIYDRKASGLLATNRIWALIPVGKSFATCDHSLRFMIPNP